MLVASVWWCALSNLAGVVPCYSFYRQGDPPSGVLVLLAAAASVLFHMNNALPQRHAIVDWFDRDAIRMVDVMLADLLLLYVSLYSAFGARQQDALRAAWFMMLPIEMYLFAEGRSADHKLARETFLLVCCGACVLFRVARMRRFVGAAAEGPSGRNLAQTTSTLYFAAACLIAVTDLFMYRWLADPLGPAKPYNMYHGVHHVLAYAAVTIFVKAESVLLEALGPPTSRTHMATADAADVELGFVGCA